MGEISVETMEQAHARNQGLTDETHADKRNPFACGSMYVLPGLSNFNCVMRLRVQYKDVKGKVDSGYNVRKEELKWGARLST